MTLNARQVDEHLAALTDIRPDMIAKRLARAVERDRRGGRAVPDGFPANTGYDKAGDASFVVDGVRVEATSVELTVIAREERHRDPVHDSVVAATKILETLIKSFDRLAGLLDGIDNLAGTTVLLPGCTSCARVNVYRERFRGDQCDWCYGFVRDKERNPDGQQPSIELLRRRESKSRLTTRDIEECMGNARA